MAQVEPISISLRTSAATPGMRRLIPARMAKLLRDSLEVLGLPSRKSCLEMNQSKG